MGLKIIERMKYERSAAGRYIVPGTGECECGEIVSIEDAMTNKCDACGAFYNSMGQRLRPPREWGEETGERFDDDGNYIDGGMDEEW